MKTSKPPLALSNLSIATLAVITSLVLTGTQIGFAGCGPPHGRQDASFAEEYNTKKRSSQAARQTREDKEDRTSFAEEYNTKKRSSQAAGQTQNNREDKASSTEENDTRQQSSESTRQAYDTQDSDKVESVPGRTYRGREEHAITALWNLTNPLESAGITLESNLTVDWSKNLTGGLNTNGSALRHLFQIAMTIDTKQLFQWNGGTIYLLFQNQNGPDASADDVGDYQIISDMDDTGGRTQISELWVEQVLLDGQLRIKFGKFDANSNFAYVENRDGFINLSTWLSPTLFTMPSYPDPATGLAVLLHPTDNFYVSMGLFDGAGQESFTTGSRGPKTFFDHPSDLFIVGEAAVSWQLGESHNEGRLALGVWTHTGTFNRWAGRTKNGITGWYMVCDQRIWRENLQDHQDAQGVVAFFQLGFADDQVSEVDLHVGGGVTWTGGIPGRDQDTMGIMASLVRFSDPARAIGVFSESNELAIEAFYEVQLTPWLSLKPDLQWIMNPGGDRLLDDALVGTLRVEVNF